MIQKIRRFIRLNKQFVMYLTIFIVGIIGLFVGLIPSAQKSIQLLRDLRVLGDEINRIQKKVTMLSLLDPATLDQYGQLVLTAVPSEKSVPTLLSTVEAVAIKNNLLITDLNIETLGSLATGSAGQPIKPEGFVLSETISLQGELLDLRNFLSDCIKVRRLVRVKNMILSTFPKSDQVSAKLSLEVFYLPLPQSIGKASDSLEPFSQKEITTLETLGSYALAFEVVSPMSSLDSTPISAEEPTAPSILDPFAGPTRIATPRPTPSPTPTSPLTPTPSSKTSPTGTPKATSTPTATPTP